MNICFFTDYSSRVDSKRGGSPVSTAHSASMLGLSTTLKRKTEGGKVSVHGTIAECVPPHMIIQHGLDFNRS